MESITILLLLVLLIAIIIAYRMGRTSGINQIEKKWQIELPKQRQEAIQRSRAVLSGQFSEQLAPYLPGFTYSPTECSFIGKPIDFIVFKGADKKEIEEIIFVEVKSGDSRLNKQEKGLKKAVEEGNVRFEEYRIDKKLTNNKEESEPV